MKLPKDTENKIYVEDYEVANINDLICKAQEKWGEEVDISSILIEHEHIQVQCFGYDQYDSGDYKNYFILINHGKECQVRVTDGDKQPAGADHFEPSQPERDFLTREQIAEFLLSDEFMAKFAKAFMDTPLDLTNWQQKSGWGYHEHQLPAEKMNTDHVEVPPEEGWQPMETAPKGRWVQVKMGDYECLGVWSACDCWVSSGLGKSLEWDRGHPPTAWREIV